MAQSRRTENAEAKKTGSLDELWKLVDGIETAMLTTRRADGHLVSRPMATQKRAPGADFWFVTMEDMPKVEEIAAEPRVNLSYYQDHTREWVSVSGEAEISRDRSKIRELWAPDWKTWFPDQGGKRDGGPEDPRIVLIGVRAVSAQYMTLDKPQPLVLFDIVKSKLTGKTPEMGEVKRVRLTGRRSATSRSSGNGRHRGRSTPGRRRSP
jgi:general stress protein 26